MNKFIEILLHLGEVEKSSEATYSFSPSWTDEEFEIRVDEAWGRVGQCIYSTRDIPEEIRQELWVFLLLYNNRYLGCRVAMDDEGNIVLVSDVYPHQLFENFVFEIISSMIVVGDALVTLVGQAARTGIIPGEADVDRAFTAAS